MSLLLLERLTKWQKIRFGTMFEYISSEMDKKEVFEHWDKMNFHEGLKGQLNEKVSKLYEYKE